MGKVELGKIKIGEGAPLVLIAGPCVIENRTLARETAAFLKEMTESIGMPFIFKCSYDKANRTSDGSFRGPGLEQGLAVLGDIKSDFGIPVLSDVHRFEEIAPAAAVLDVLQVPAFLSRQTDFIQEVARAAKAVNIKKGQFLAPSDMIHAVAKAWRVGNENIMITERGSSFGYNNLVVDFRGLPIMRKAGIPVIFDATHSVQLPGGSGNVSGGDREMVSYLARAAAAAGVDGIFMEVHPDPDRALCDGPNSLRLESLPRLLAVLKEIDGLVKDSEKNNQNWTE